MTSAQIIWAVAGICALGLLPVGAVRMIAYRSGEVDHTPALHFVARLAVWLGTACLLVFLGLTAWFLATGRRPV